MSALQRRSARPLASLIKSRHARDNTQTEAHGRATFDLSPRIGVLVDATADHRDYNNTPGLSSDGQTYLAGITLNGDLFRGEFAVGYFRRDFNTLNTFDGLAVEGNIDWLVTELTTISLQARRDANSEISANVGLPYVTTEVGVRADHELLRNVILFAEYRQGQREYNTIDRKDDYSQVGVGADYVLNRRVALRLRFDHFADDSSGTAAYHDYNVNTGTVGLSLRL
ncbi:MAG: outer membrane beta-barrel protein [Proteobacteria bacterium]|nr:outer membrane beta-barrel protein [Pseudomonadota bacterium]